MNIRIASPAFSKVPKKGLGRNDINDFVLLETNKFDRENYLSYFFAGPVGIITCSNLEGVKNCFEKIEKALRKGYYLAGFLSYEAGYAFEEVFQKFPVSHKFPLLWFGVFKKPIIFNSQKKSLADWGHCINTGEQRLRFKIKNLRTGVSKKEYLNNCGIIKNLIASGDTYQVNYTFKNKFNFWGSPFGLYSDLKNKQAVSYSALIRCGQHYILSSSPELFFRLDGRKITVKPMKGTIKRGFSCPQDRILASSLKKCPKNRSENLMIVDMLRNDLGKISEFGSVKVQKLFEIEKYQTLFQMTSTVTGQVLEGVSFYKIFKSIFPSASVTGAPKIRTMEIIRQLEKEPRGLYTGAIGFISPAKKAVFNVAIRTVLLDSEKGAGEMGAGSGIVYDSVAEGEWFESLLKTRFLKDKFPADFQLIETMLLEPGRGIFLLDYHLKRLQESATYFGFCYEKRKILNRLGSAITKLARDKTWRIRLILKENGVVEIFSEPVEVKWEGQVKIAFSKTGTNSEDIFLYHKTSHRPLYNKELARGRRAGYFEVIFTNQKGQVTEGAISNIFLKKGGKIFTPPVEVGLLNGVFRQYFMEKHHVEEKIIYPDDVFGAEEVFLTNAVRGLMKVSCDSAGFPTLKRSSVQSEIFIF